MCRLLMLTTILAATACTTETEPQTDTGQLVRLNDTLFGDCQDNPDTAFTCGVLVTFGAEGRIDAVGTSTYDKGPAATGTLNEATRAEIAELISQIPVDAATVHDPGCGLAPLRTTNVDIQFDHDGAHHFDIEYAAQGPMADFTRRLEDLVTAIRTCSSNDVSFDSCQPNVAL
jgi:hypothetical protein